MVSCKPLVANEKKESAMQEADTILNVIEQSDKNLDEIINHGIVAGLELARDDGIDFTLSCQVSNGDSSKMQSYKNRLMNKELTDNDNAIISKYQNI
jgi:hypothetical protein